jgi:hypothetical protein
MGGAYHRRGKVTPAAEFNIYVEPHPAAVVFNSGIPITVLPLDVTQKVLNTKAPMERLESLTNPASKLIVAILLSHARRVPQLGQARLSVVFTAPIGLPKQSNAWFESGQHPPPTVVRAYFKALCQLLHRN